MGGQDFRDVALRALRRIEQLETEIATMARSRPEPIAIVGLGCRLPGAETPERLWDLLMRGGDAVGAVPPSRWGATDLEALGARGAEVDAALRGGFVQDPAVFDPEFFNISPREAETIDPQQRLLLEVAWEALEDAGLPPSVLPKDRTGVFVGISGMDYALELAASSSATGPDPYLTTGSAHSVASGRLAYAFGLGGPAVSIDTACSSSAVALHMARRSLLAGDCDIALVAGVNRLLLPHVSLQFARANMLSATGRCHTFAADADGFVRSEGCGAIVLRRSSDAKRDGDRVYALLVGSATNQDGKTSGMTVPNGSAQERVILAALQDAGLSADDIGYVEAHGTGTRLGDPIELRALQRVHRERAGARLRIGSIKANLGHLEAAAGVTGVIKAALMLRRGAIPPHAAHGAPTAEVNWDEAPLEVARSAEPWPLDLPRRVGVSSFGFSGTNAHFVLAEAPEPADRIPALRSELIVIAARSAGALEAAATAVGAQAAGESDLSRLAFTAARRRHHFVRRAYGVVAAGRDLTFSVGAAEGSAVPFFRLGPTLTRPVISATTLARWPRLREAFEQRLGGSLIDDAVAAGSGVEPALVDFLEAVGLRLRGAGDAQAEGDTARKSMPRGDSSDPGELQVLDVYGSDQVLDEALLLDAIGRAYAAGATIDWALVFPEQRPLVSLPPYAFQRRSMLQRRWRPSATDGRSAKPSAKASGVVLRPIELTLQGLEDAPVERTSLGGDGRVLAAPTDMGGAMNLLSALLAESAPQPVILTLPKKGTTDHQLVSAFLIAAARVLRLERPNLRLACVGDTPPDPVSWSSASVAWVSARTPLWWGALDRGRIETLGAELAAHSISDDDLDRSTMIVGRGATAEDLVRSLRGRGLGAVHRDWAAPTAPPAGVARLIAIIPRADRREVVTSSNLGLLAEAYQAQAAHLDTFLDRLSGPVDLRLVRGLEGSFGWPGRLVDVALGEYAWSKALDLNARGGRATCIDWPVLRTGAEDRAELDRIAAHGLSEPPVEALAETLLRPLPSAGRFVAHCPGDATLVETGVAVGVLAARFRSFESSGSKRGDDQRGFLRIVIQTLGLRNMDPDPELSLLDLGADSLMGLEIAKRAQAELGLDIDIQDLLSDLPIGELANRFDGAAPSAARSIQRSGHVVSDGV